MRRAVGLPSTSVLLSTICAAQTWTNCPIFSLFLLFPCPPPILCSFPSFSILLHGLWHFSPSVWPLKPSPKWLKSGSVCYSNEQSEGEKVFIVDVYSIPLFFCFALFDLESWSPDGKNATPECESGALSAPTFHSLIFGSDVNHLLSSTRKCEHFCCFNCILVQWVHLLPPI